MRKRTNLAIISVFSALLLLLLTFIFVRGSLFQPKSNEPLPDDVKGDNTSRCTQLYDQVESEFSQLSLSRKWYIKSPLAKENNIHFSFPLKNDNLTVSYSLNGEESKAVQTVDGWEIDLEIEELTDGEKNLSIYADFCEEEIYKDFTFNVSEPIYVTWTIDWEGLDVKDEYLKAMSDVSSQYSIPMTHFFNPNIYILLPESRARYLTEWTKERNTKYSESIGLHLHMYNPLVQAAGVTPNNTNSWGSGWSNGHDTPNSNYGYEDYKKIIGWSISQFNKNGLEKPTMFRAGAWFLDEENIQVLNDMEFNIESSGRTNYKHGRNGIEGYWNLNSTTQPYQMNRTDQNIISNPNLNIWQFPNNGGDSWAYSSNQMIKNFNTNYSGGISNRTKTITFLSHPHWFNQEGPKIKGTFKYISQYSYHTDSGPVIFTTLDKVYEDIVKL